MPVVPVSTTQAYAIAGVGTTYSGFTVQNSGTSRLYFASDPGVSASNFGNFVDPNGSIAWPEGESCYVIAGAAGGQVNYSPLVAGMAGAASGSVSLVPGGSVGIAGTVKLNNAPIKLYNQAGNLPTGTNQILDTAGTDLTSFSTFYFSVGNTGGVGSPSAQPSQVTVTQYANGSQISSKNYNFLISGSILIYDDIVGDRIVFSVVAYVGSNVGIYASIYPNRITPYQSLAPMPGLAAYFPPTMTVGGTGATQFDGYIGFDASTNTAGVSSIHLPHTTGPGYSYLEVTSAEAWALEYYQNPISNAARVINYNESAAFITAPPTPVFLRCYPLIISCAGTTLSGARLIYSLTSTRNA